MTRITRLLFLAALVSAGAFAQLTTTNTKLSAAITSNTQTSVTLASGTGVAVPTAMTAGSYLYVDTEAMQVMSNFTGTTYTVKRAQLGTAARTHASGALVWVGNVAGSTGDTSRPFTGGPFFSGKRNSIPAGSCTASAQYTLPVIDTDSGIAYTCISGAWQTVNTSDTVPAPIVGNAVASASTITPTANTFHVTGTAAISTINVPAGFAPGQCITLIPDGLFTTATGGNIALATTAVVSKALLECWDGTKFFPSY